MMHPEDTDRWQAVYRDGTMIDEDEITETKNDGDDVLVRRRGWAEVDAAQVRAIQIREGVDVMMAAVIPEGATPVLFRRRAIATDVGGAEPVETDYMTLTVIGWNWPDGSACWLWRGVDGRVVMTAGDVQE